MWKPKQKSIITMACENQTKECYHYGMWKSKQKRVITMVCENQNQRVIWYMKNKNTYKIQKYIWNMKIHIKTKNTYKN